MKVQDPFILSLKLDAVSLEHLSAWRSRFFPPERNFLPAHLTLYHRLPFAGREVIVASLLRRAAQSNPFDLSFKAWHQNGGFLGITVDCPALIQLKRDIDHDLSLWLAPQDRLPFKPHVTITNNAAPEVMNQALSTLQSEFVPWTGRGEGLQLFRYRRGPWEWTEDYNFQIEQFS